MSYSNSATEHMLVAGLVEEGEEAFQVPSHSDSENEWMSVGKVRLFRYLQLRPLSEQLVVCMLGHCSRLQEQAQELGPSTPVVRRWHWLEIHCLSPLLLKPVRPGSDPHDSWTSNEHDDPNYLSEAEEEILVLLGGSESPLGTTAAKAVGMQRRNALK